MVKPLSVGRLDSLLNEITEWRLFRDSMRSIQKVKLYHIAKCVDVVLHLEHHDFRVVVVAMQAKHS
jgi:negative regulator of sigma E activity